MTRRIALLVSASMLASCASTTTPSATPRMQVDEEYLKLCPLDLPRATDGTDQSLLRNRVLTATQMRTCARNHNALVEQVKNHLEAQSAKD